MFAYSSSPVSRFVIRECSVIPSGFLSGTEDRSNSTHNEFVSLTLGPVVNNGHHRASSKVAITHLPIPAILKRFTCFLLLFAFILTLTLPVQRLLQHFLTFRVLQFRKALLFGYSDIISRVWCKLVTSARYSEVHDIHRMDVVWQPFSKNKVCDPLEEPVYDSDKEKHRGVDVTGVLAWL